MQLFWFFYFILMNLAALYLMYSDKQKAIKKAWRVPEVTLLSFCLLGGAIGTYLGMKYFHHKTQHWYFHVAIIFSTFAWLIGLPYFYLVL
ncbi:hypothetical protein A6B39_06775 [Mannheimia granulomatis]|uniref:Membrane protein n=1 Tax=Mannheimia granulomatis TaxID=85402 RepID=A0A011MJD6_9PAST|nr:DUF1294 domain-containing protein [Mannheimia granulomatis]EXI62601.1 membrane protein [Mannheimia granulomatis]QLB15177.1 hypothetical protein A6B39_06775 [Mannheimia granulomatis]RGE47941.1 membrane protein [Mannheimia granulomatis]